jgi:hypothetical protein
MRNTDNNFTAFCGFYKKADFDNAANVLYHEITKIVSKDMLLNPLVKLDLSEMLQRLASHHIPLPTRDSYRETIKRAVRYLLDNKETDLRQVLN